LHKITVSVVGSAALSPLIEHVFREGPEFEIVSATVSFTNLGQAETPHPELIVVSVKPVTTGICRTVASIKETSPGSKVIVVCPVQGFARAAKQCGADAYVSDEKLAGSLLRTARALSEWSRPAGAGNR